MEPNLAATLSSSLGVGESPTLRLDFPRDAEGKLVALGAAIVVQTEAGAQVTVDLRPVRELFRGSARAPDLSAGPTPRLMPFFLFLETVLVRFCKEDGRDETDQEMENIFSQLRRRPDGQPTCLLHSYLRAAAQIYLSARDVSEAEYEAVMTRLTKSARTFSMPPISRNYLKTLRQTVGRIG